MMIQAKAGDRWQVDVQSDKPATPQQFFAMVSEIQAEGGEDDSPFDVVSSTAIDSTHFRVILKWRGNAALDSRQTAVLTPVDGVNFTVSYMGPARSETLTVPTVGGSSWVTGAIGLAVVAGLVSVPVVIGTRVAKKHPGAGGAAGAMVGILGTAGLLLFLGKP